MKGLAREKMLKKKFDFQRVYEKGTSYASRYLVLYLLPSDELGGLVGFAAGKKLGGAVVRNRVKRLMRECYRLHQEKLRAGYAVLLVGRKPIVGATFADVEKTYLYLGRKSGLFQKGKGQRTSTKQKASASTAHHRFKAKKAPTRETPHRAGKTAMPAGKQEQGTGAER